MSYVVLWMEDEYECSPMTYAKTFRDEDLDWALNSYEELVKLAKEDNGCHSYEVILIKGEIIDRNCPESFEEKGPKYVGE